MIWVVRACSLYNASALVAFLIPGMLSAFGVAVPDASFWLWLPSLLALFAAITLWISSRDLVRYGAFVYWNGLIRITFAIVSFLLDFGGSVGAFIALLAAGDLVLGLACIVGLPMATGRKHAQLLLDQHPAARN